MKYFEYFNIDLSIIIRLVYVMASLQILQKFEVRNGSLIDSQDHLGSIMLGTCKEKFSYLMSNQERVCESSMTQFATCIFTLSQFFSGFWRQKKKFSDGSLVRKSRLFTQIYLIVIYNGDYIRFRSAHNNQDLLSSILFPVCRC